MISKLDIAIVMLVAFLCAGAVVVSDEATAGNSDEETNDIQTEYVAEVTISGNTEQYATITEAVTAACAADTAIVKLLKSVTEDVKITKGVVTLDLAGFTLTNVSDNALDTITVDYGAELILTDTSSTAGTVDNVTHQRAAIYNNGTVTIDNGVNLTRSAEKTGNTYYVILNHGYMTIENVKLTVNGDFSSAIASGYYDYSGDTYKGERNQYIDGINAEYPTLTINGGTFTGGLNTVKVDDGSSAKITGGLFENTVQASLFNVSKLEITGGTFTAPIAIYARHYNDSLNVGSVTISNPENVTIQGMIQLANGAVITPLPEKLGYVASVTSGTNVSYYKTLADAVSAASADSTITLLREVSLDSNIEFSVKATLDLNGHKVTTGKFSFKVLAGGDLTVKGSEGSLIEGTRCINVYGSSANPGKLTIESGEFKAVEQCVGFYAYTEVVINGGTFTSTDNGVLMSNGTQVPSKEYYGAHYSLIVNGGIFNAGITTEGYIAMGVYATNIGSVKLNGGTFNVENGVGVAWRAGELYVSEKVVFNITGTERTEGWIGDCKQIVKANQLVACCPVSGYPDLGDYSGAALFDAKIGKVYYSTLAYAVSAASADSTITLLREVSLDSNIEFSVKATLDLNGHKVTTGKFSFKVLAGGDLTVKGSEGSLIEGTRCINVYGSSANPGKLTIESGEFKAVEQCVGFYAYTEVVINGGTFTSTDNGVLMSNGTQVPSKEYYGAHYSLIVNGGIFNAGITTEGYIAMGVYATNIGSVKLNGGTFNVENGVGVAWRAGELYVSEKVVFNITGTERTEGWIGDCKQIVKANQLVACCPVSGYPDLGDYSGAALFDAKIGKVYYSTLAYAVDAATDGCTITVLKEGVHCVKVEGKTVKFDGEPLVHTLVKTNSKEPTATESGNREYYTCSVCEHVFKADQKTETTVLDETTYLVIFMNEKSEISSTVLDYGEKIVVPANPTKEATAQYTYTFKGWSIDGTTIVDVDETAIKCVTYNAVYTETLNEYEITFMNEGKELLKIMVPYGTVPEYTGEVPTKEATTQYTYTFKGWNPEVVAVTGDATYNAVFSSTVNKYEITFMNEGVILQKSEFEYGATPKYTGAEPTKAATAQYTYTFKGWDPEVVTVTGAATYNAVFSSTVNKYEITFMNEGVVLQKSEFEYGATPKYTGAEPTKAPTAQYTYTFIGWDHKIAPVIGTATYNAVFSSTVNEYTITFMNEGKELQKSKVPYGLVPAYFGPTPTKEATAQYTYTFDGWNPKVVAVTGDATYNAVFSSTVNEYEIAFMNEGKELLKIMVPYGTVPEYTGEVPTKEATAQYTYTFKGWNPEIVAVTGNATYEAIFSSTVNEYEIVFMNGTEVLQSTMVKYGETPVYAGATPTKADSETYTYLFAGWNPKVVSVVSAATYNAIFVEYAKEVKEAVIEAETEDSASITKDAMDKVNSDLNIGIIDSVSVKLNNGSITFDKDAASKIQDDSMISLVREEAPVLPDAAISKVGDRPVYEILVISSRGEIHEFDGILTVSVKYDLREGEDAKNIYILYIRDDGSLTSVDAKYADGYVTFTTDHLSVYAVAFKEVNTINMAAILGILVAVVIAVAAGVFCLKYTRRD